MTKKERAKICSIARGIDALARYLDPDTPEAERVDHLPEGMSPARYARGLASELVLLVLYPKTGGK